MGTEHIPHFLFRFYPDISSASNVAEKLANGVLGLFR